VCTEVLVVVNGERMTMICPYPNRADHLYEKSATELFYHAVRSDSCSWVHKHNLRCIRRWRVSISNRRFASIRYLPCRYSSMEIAWACPLSIVLRSLEQRFRSVFGRRPSVPLLIVVAFRLRHTLSNRITYCIHILYSDPCVVGIEYILSRFPDQSYVHPFGACYRR
jgi:hypothetical protein